MVVSPFSITRVKSGISNYLGTLSIAEEKSRSDIEGNLNESGFYKKMDGSDLMESKELLVSTVEIQGHG